MELKFNRSTIFLSALSLILIGALCVETIQISRLETRLESAQISEPAAGQPGPVGVSFEHETNLPSPEGFSPRLDLRDEGTNFVIRMDLPGADKSLVKATVKDRILTISGKREELKEEKSEEGNLIHAERSFGSFERQVSLPEAAKEGAAGSEYINGVLKITIPKAGTEDRDQEYMMMDWRL